MKMKKKNLPRKNNLGIFIKNIKKSNFVIFIVIICLTLAFCVITLSNIVDIAYGVDKNEETKNTVSSEYNDLFVKIDMLKASTSNNQRTPLNSKNPFSG